MTPRIKNGQNANQTGTLWSQDDLGKTLVFFHFFFITWFYGSSTYIKRPSLSLNATRRHQAHPVCSSYVNCYLFSNTCRREAPPVSVSIVRSQRDASPVDDCCCIVRHKLDNDRNKEILLIIEDKVSCPTEGGVADTYRTHEGKGRLTEAQQYNRHSPG